MVKRVLLLSASVLAAVAVQAATVTYTGGNLGSWFNAQNWSSGAIPTDEDDVTVEGKTVYAQNGPIAAKSLTITGSSTVLHLGKDTLAPQTIAAITDDLTVTGGAKLYV